MAGTRLEVGLFDRENPQSVLAEHSTDASRLERLKQQPANMQTSIQFEIVSDEIETKVPVTKRSFFVPDVGLCHTYDEFGRIQLTCRAGLELNVETAMRIDPGSPDVFIADFPKQSLPCGLNPTADSGAAMVSNLPPNPQFAFIPRRRIAAFERTLDLHNIRLTDYIVPVESRLQQR
jgi:hypothetical protein